MKSSSDTEILFPNKEIKLNKNESLTVKELEWNEGLEFVRELSKQMSIVTELANAVMASKDGKTFSVQPGTIASLITGSADLAGSLVRKATGLDDEGMKKLSMSKGLEVLDLALELNLTNELLEKGKKIAGRLQSFAAGGPARTPEKSTTSSSGKGTVGPT